MASSTLSSSTEGHFLVSAKFSNHYQFWATCEDIPQTASSDFSSPNTFAGRSTRLPFARWNQLPLENGNFPSTHTLNTNLRLRNSDDNRYNILKSENKTTTFRWDHWTSNPPPDRFKCSWSIGVTTNGWLQTTVKPLINSRTLMPIRCQQQTMIEQMTE